MSGMIRSSRDNLVWIIKHRLREGNNFFLGTKNKEYWRRMIERDIEGATVEDWDDGLVVRR